MVVRVIGVPIAVLFAFIPLTKSQAQVTPQPAMFSPWYAESLRDILTLEASDVARLQGRLASNPEDSVTRLKLMAYHQRGDRASQSGDRAERARHALWLIKHHPDSEILHSPVSRFLPGELPTGVYGRATALWEAAAFREPGNAAVQWNAASFFQGLDPGLYLRYLEATAAADPNHPFALRPLAELYALSILERGPISPRAEAGLEASKNVWVLGNAAYMFQSQYNRTLQMGTPNPRAAELAERYFLRAKTLAPNLDRKAILPQLDVGAPQRPEKVRAEEATAEIRRLPVEAFPELPATVSGVLRARHCRVPQPASGAARRNVIRGRFYSKEDAGWAVLCFVNSSTALLVFRNDGDTNPDTVITSDDLGYVQGLGGGQAGYSHEITAASRDFIIRQYRAYGGPEPPPIDHQGIDDAFLEKASSIWYFHQGKWLRLRGAD